MSKHQLIINIYHLHTVLASFQVILQNCLTTRNTIKDYHKHNLNMHCGEKILVLSWQYTSLTQQHRPTNSRPTELQPCQRDSIGLISTILHLMNSKRQAYKLQAYKTPACHYHSWNGSYGLVIRFLTKTFTSYILAAIHHWFQRLETVIQVPKGVFNKFSRSQMMN